MGGGEQGYSLAGWERSLAGTLQECSGLCRACMQVRSTLHTLAGTPPPPPLSGLAQPRRRMTVQGPPAPRRQEAGQRQARGGRPLADIHAPDVAHQTGARRPTAPRQDLDWTAAGRPAKPAHAPTQRAAAATLSASLGGPWRPGGQAATWNACSAVRALRVRGRCVRVCGGAWAASSGRHVTHARGGERPSVYARHRGRTDGAAVVLCCV